MRCLKYEESYYYFRFMVRHIVLLLTRSVFDDRRYSIVSGIIENMVLPGLLAILGKSIADNRYRYRGKSIADTDTQPQKYRDTDTDTLKSITIHHTDTAINFSINFLNCNHLISCTFVLFFKATKRIF